MEKKYFNWNDDKNKQLISERNVSFEDVVYYIQKGDLLDDLKNTNKVKYPGQRVLVVNIESYAYLVPYIENDDGIFLKTIIPSRKATKIYLGESNGRQKID